MIAATATAVGIVAAGKSAKTPSVTGGIARVGGTAPAFSSWDLNGNQVSLAEFKGRPVLLTFWATWCTACQEELPALQRIRDQYQSAGFSVLAVNYKETSDARMSEYLAKLKVNLEAVIDPEGAIASAYGVDIGLPISVMLDRKDVVRQFIVGVVPGATLESAIRNVVEPTG